ncbi:MAG: protein kinase [Pegethrix bostrychoides GSE-TBD4-15B]|jgi:WD40 repeat protein/tRNA A-37 threonylcarbamoyl transferase component Bud32|uniref:Protein kinase n=1 Tax=Pegethrix bostrychoides GSE-TBD4-15B TaxID=2839662 RepID=A0A951U6L4_9CYAN|nr:protein kinase [Pegethrix bostrychoides GSE-TBD4-15B]
MICCLNPQCQKPVNPDDAKVCQNCGTALTLLRGRYQATQLLGQGGFGRTYLALDADRLNSECVIKQFSPQVQGTKSLEKAVQLFNQEAVRLHELGEHAQIPALLAYFEQEGYLYLVQQFIEGQSLLQEMKQHGAFNERQIRDVFADVLPILRFVHRHQVIHRDITPMNILRRQSDDRLMLIDFGVAKQLSEETPGEAGTRIGTEGYAPMEQFRGGKAYPASDLYSLGATCLHLMTEARPDSLYDPLNGQWFWREYLQQKKGTTVSDQLAHILDYLLKDLVNERYQSADEVMRDLNADSFLPATRPTISPPAPPAPPPASDPRSRSAPPNSRPPNSRPPTSSPPSRPPASRPPVARPASDSAPARTSGTPRGSRCLQVLTGHSSWVTCVVPSPNAPTFASSSLDDTIRVWNLHTGEPLLTMTGHNRGVNTIAISPDGRTLVSGSDDYTVRVWSFLNGSLLGALTGHSRDVNAVAISPDGKLLVSGGEDRTIRLWSTNTGALLKTLAEVAGMIKTVAISPDGKFLASGGLDNKTKLWSLRTGEYLQTFIGHINPVHAILFTPDGQTLITASKDKTIRLWNVQTGELIRTLSDHIRDVNALALTANGRILVSGSSDNTIKFWDLAAGKVLMTWSEHSDTVNSLALSPDGKLLLSGSSDKTIRIWQMPT